MLQITIKTEPVVVRTIYTFSSSDEKEVEFLRSLSACIDGFGDGYDRIIVAKFLKILQHDVIDAQRQI